jgi:Flp pilus assembly secretin CpaC
LLTNQGEPAGMRNLSLALLLALVPAAASAASLSVSLDQAVRLTLRGPAHDVIVGNPAIADVTVADQRHLVIVGKSFGVTNLMVISESGRTLFNEQIVVGTAGAGRVSLYRGPDAVTYACSPSCERSAGGAASAPPAPANVPPPAS